jgi:hypothetical protein
MLPGKISCKEKSNFFARENFSGQSLAATLLSAVHRAGLGAISSSRPKLPGGADLRHVHRCFMLIKQGKT